MDKSIVKKAFGEAEKLAEEEKKEKIKNIILETLRKLESFKKDREELDKRIKILKKDLEDFRQGRLDLIEERQKVDELAKKTSVIEVKKITEEHLHYYPRPWYEPYCLTWTYTDCSHYTDTTTGTVNFATRDSATLTSSSNSSNFAGTDFHIYYSGSYEVDDKIVNL